MIFSLSGNQFFKEDNIIKDLKAIDVMVRPVVSARKNTSARDVALQLFTGLYSGMPVTDEEGKVVGIITELDLLDALRDGKDSCSRQIHGRQEQNGGC